MATRSAWGEALKLLGRRDYFSSELEQRLLGKGHPAEEVEEALERGRAAGLLDDGRVAARFVELRAGSRGWGPRRLSAELLKRGASREVAERAVGAAGAALLDAALEVALERAERRMADGWWRLSASRARMVSSLLNRGFEADDARDAVERLAALRESEHDAVDDIAGDPPGLS